MFAFAVLPSVAAAETVVPPGNSAATQYTETFPTPGGNAEVNSSINGGGGSSGGGKRSPKKVLGSETANQLESHGEEGQAVAELATESAPETEETSGGGGAGKSGGSNGGGRAGKAGLSGNRVVAGGAQTLPSGTALAAETPQGSSGFSEVLSHATGSSSGEMGIFLPLVLLAVPLCALLYAWRRRQPDRAAS